MKRERTPTGEAATELILSAFRANGLLLDAWEKERTERVTVSDTSPKATQSAA